MTKREFDKATKQNWRCRMAGDERSYYRHGRGLPNYGSAATGPSNAFGSDLLAERAWERRRSPRVPLRSLRTAPKRLGDLVFLRNGESIVKRRVTTPERFDDRDAERMFRDYARRMGG